jgi:hypothetical protein
MSLLIVLFAMLDYVVANTNAVTGIGLLPILFESASASYTWRLMSCLLVEWMVIQVSYHTGAGTSVNKLIRSYNRVLIIAAYVTMLIGQFYYATMLLRLPTVPEYALLVLCIVRMRSIISFPLYVLRTFWLQYIQTEQRSQYLRFRYMMQGIVLEESDKSFVHEE